MRTPWRSGEYERVCGDCGYAWRVSKSASRPRVGWLFSLFAPPCGSVNLGQADLDAQVSAISAANLAADSCQQCPVCGADRFTQHKVHSTP